MINLSEILVPSTHIRARAQKMWATKYDAGQFTLTYKVVPFSRFFSHKEKDRRLVLFDFKRGVAECLSLETGSFCEANSYGRLCSHVYRSFVVMQAANKRQEAV